MPNCRCGIVFLAFGEPYLAMALLSAQTAKKNNPGVPLHIISNIENYVTQKLSFWDSKEDRWTTVNDSEDRNRYYKTNVANMVNFDKAVYLDCDTLVTGSVNSAWKFLDYFDICLKMHRGRQVHKYLLDVPVLEKRIPVRNLPHWNGGVIMFRNNDQTKDFFSSWRQNFVESGVKFDQPSLVKTVFESRCRVLSLDERWNGGFREVDHDDGGIATFVHYHSALDSFIEDRLRVYGELMEQSGVCSATDKIRDHIWQKNKMRRRNEGAKWFLRRMYRRYWHRKHMVTF